MYTANAIVQDCAISLYEPRLLTNHSIVRARRRDRFLPFLSSAEMSSCVGSNYGCTVALVFSVLVVCASSQTRRYSRTIYVDPERGNDTKNCVEEPSYDVPCRSLSYAFQTQYRNSSTSYSLQPGTHYLDSTNASDTPFTALTDIAITGNASSPNSVKILCSTDNTGLSFNGASNVFLQNVTISGCSALQNSTSRNFSSHFPDFSFSLTRVAIYFNDCENVSMDNVQVTHNPGATGVIIYNTNGTNQFLNCNFSSNVGKSEDTYPGGGGMFVEFSYCLPGVDTCENGTKDGYTDRNKNSFYLFNQCTFSDNNAQTGVVNASTPTFLVPFRQDHVAFGRGGGLSLYLNANSAQNRFIVTGCTFSNNRAEYGAGMFLEFHDNSTGNNVIVNGLTHFTDNNCHKVAGGGMRVAHYVFGTGDTVERNTVELSDVRFLRNYAGSGGGLSISPSLQSAPDSQLFSMFIERAEFISNHAPYGAALRIDLFGLIVAGREPSITMAHCLFFNNSVNAPVYTQPVEDGLGAVYISDIDVSLGDSTFLFNSGSALALVASGVYFTGKTKFFLNTGTNGGAIALLGSSRIIIDYGVQLYFDGNWVTNRGGAIFNEYADKSDYRNSPQCFVVHTNPFICPDDWGAVFQFVENHDSQGPNSIYSTSILPCAISGGTSQELVRQILCWSNWTYNGTKDCSNHIRTGPGLIRVEKTAPYAPLGSTQDEDKLFITAYSGQYIPLYYVAFDDLNHSLQVPYMATITNGTQSEYTGAKLDPYYTYVTQNTLKVYQYEYTGTSVTVNLDEVGDRAWHIEVNIELGSCPPGLLPTNISCDSTNEGEKLCVTCQCNTDANYRETVHCNTNYSATLLSDCWMGERPDRGNNVTDYVTGICPSGFCQLSGAEFSPIPEADLDRHICGSQRRTGVLCGECIEHHGVALNSDILECVFCNISSHQLALHATYYVLSVYVPLFLLFLAIIVFNIKLTTGPANSFILFSQVISSTFDINRLVRFEAVIPHVNVYLTIQKFIYGISNLKFFEQFIPSRHLCLGTSLSVLDILLLDYIVALTPLLMIIVIIFIYKTNCCCIRNSRCRRSSETVTLRKGTRYLKMGKVKIKDAVLPAFASFVLLSYTKFCLISSYLTVPQSLYNSHGHSAGTDRVFYAGQYSTTDGKYLLYYKTPAILVFLTIVTIPPLLLFKYPLMIFEKIVGKIHFLKKYYPKASIHVLLDTFQGCYKDRYRWFAGLYFLFRLVININYTFANLYEQYLFQGIFCIAMALLVAYLKPYRNKFHVFNYVDSLVFLNLAIINQITFYTFAFTRQGRDPPAGAFAVQYILVFLPLVYMSVYVVWRLLPIPRVRTRVREWLENRRHTHQMENLIQNKSNTDSRCETPDDVDWERARTVNRYRPLRSPETPPFTSDGPLHSSVSLTNSLTDHNDDDALPTLSTAPDSSRQGYGSTDSGVTSANDRPS